MTGIDKDIYIQYFEVLGYYVNGHQDWLTLLVLRVGDGERGKKQVGKVEEQMTYLW